MKKFAFTISFFQVFFAGYAQVPPPAFPGDTMEIWTVISFDEPTDYIIVDTAASNLWQIGPPQKTFFEAAYTPPNAIVSDTSGLYPPDNHSWFDLIIGEFNMGGQYMGAYPYDIFVDFRHKYDTDTLHDGGYLEVSWDYGQTFMNIIEDTLYDWGVVPGVGWDDMNLYTPSDTLYNGEFGYSGHSNGWIHTSFAWHILPVDLQWFDPPDTMIIRFHFISDAIDNAYEGWMIDQIRLFSLDLGSGIDHPSKESSFTITPNPFSNTAEVQLPQFFALVEAEVINSRGMVVACNQFHTCREFKINRGNLFPGIYFLKLVLDQNDIQIQRFVIVN